MSGVLAVTVPIYLVMAAGWAATRGGLFARADMRVFGQFVIRIALPLLLFKTVSEREVAEVLNPVFLAAYAGGSLLAMGAGLFWARRVAGKPLAASAIVGMGMSCPNSGYIGFPLVLQVFGADTAAVAVGLGMVVENVLLIPLALAIADSDLGDAAAGETRRERLRAALAQSARALARNPLIHGIAAGFLFAAMDWRLPAPVDKAVLLVAACSAPLALFVIGGSLVGLRIGGMRRDVATIAAGKLVLHPLAVLLLVVLLPPMAEDLQSAAVLMAAVPMLGIYPILAQKHGLDTQAAAAQLGTTILSFFTLSSLLLLLAQAR